MTSKNKRVYKVLLLGDSSVGKTSLRTQFIHHAFSSSYRATMGSDFLTSQVQTEEGPVTLQIWDTAGQERFNSLGFSFYRGADAAILVYDITNATTFNSLGKWLDNFYNHCDNGRAVVMLVGNKSDKSAYRTISLRQAQEFANVRLMNSYDPQNVIETSAKVNQGVRELFEQVAAKVTMSNARDDAVSFELDTIDLKPVSQSRCCF
uniref:ARAD1A18612p n=1 Tax=Blastobotrys adeninivorans TaxID=409370 RepID=A0A060T3T1_BLAAD